MRRLFVLTVLVGVLFTLAAFGQRASGSSCDQAFAVASLRSTSATLDRAVMACPTVADWTAAAQTHPGALSGDPVDALLSRCLYDGLEATAICREAESQRAFN